MSLIQGTSMASAAGGFDVPNAIHLNASASQYFTRTPASAGNRRTFTISWWQKVTGLVNPNFKGHVIGTNVGTYDRLNFGEDSTAKLAFTFDGAGSSKQCFTTALFRDNASYGHFVAAVDTTQVTDTNRVKIYYNGVQQTLTGTFPTLNYQSSINNNVAQYVGSDRGSTYFLDGNISEFAFVDGQALDPSYFGEFADNGEWRPIDCTATVDAGGGNSFLLRTADGVDDKNDAVSTIYTLGSSAWTGDTGDFTTLARDIVPALGNVGGIYHNNTFAGACAVQFQWQGGANPAYLHLFANSEVGSFTSNTATAGVTSMTDAFSVFVTAGYSVNLLRGSTTVSTGIDTLSAGDWIKLARDASGNVTFSVNGSVLYTWTATSTATMRFAVSQNASSMDWRYFTLTDGSTTPANSFYPVNNPTDTASTPTTIYPTWNQLANASGATLSNGNLTIAGPASGSVRTNATIPFPASGKWYFETLSSSSGEIMIGVSTNPYGVATTLTSDANSWILYNDTSPNSQVYNGAGATPVTPNTTFASGSRFMCAIDADNGKIWWGKNGTWYSSGNPAAGTGEQYSNLPANPLFATIRSYNTTNIINFGATAFAYTPPTGFIALNSANIYENDPPAIEDGSAHFQTALHTGTGSAITINQTGNSTFTPDFVWSKGRSGATDHILSNVISGTGKYLKSNSTAAEVTDAQALTAFGAGSISYGTLAAANTNAATYVDWMWKANGAGVSNASGSITSTVSANTTAGFSIVTYTSISGGTGTVAHGLGQKPAMMIFKNMDAITTWYVWHKDLTNETTYAIYLNDYIAQQNVGVNTFNNTAPTSSVFSIGNDSNINQSTNNISAYCVAEVPGYSKFGSYTGNGSTTDGPFVYFGFKPAFLLVKCSSSTSDWWIWDAVRDPYNLVDRDLYPNLNTTEDGSLGSNGPDFLSNGFKFQSSGVTGNEPNQNGVTYIYAAFASVPSYGATPAKAR